MKILIQKVKFAKCFINKQLIGEINNGYLIYIGIEEKDESREEEIIEQLLKIKFIDEENKFKKSLLEIKPEIMLIPNITLVSNIETNKPEFKNSPSRKMAERIYYRVLKILQNKNFFIKNGIFGENMIIESQNIGPINFILDI
ncbi:MAG: hypothetical protein KatS3mg094_601 [Candidatus Parcubacteria bacterium]|nr:MAG: hypothetical protein KatS3mg094_601 [Candidatus Parcubacteria bacterium]